MKKIPVIDQNSGEYNLRYNVESTTEDYYFIVGVPIVFWILLYMGFWVCSGFSNDKKR